MPNVSVSSPIRVFHHEPLVCSDDLEHLPVDYLRRREHAERAAAKASTTVAARRAHQELAQLIFAARREAEKGPAK
jgi:hypothetical protein